MAFTITEAAFGNYTLFKLINKITGSMVEIIPDCGALLNRFSIEHPGNVEIINGYLNPTDLFENLTKNFKGVILSPFANRVNKAEYEFNQTTYKLNKVWKDKDYAIHGYLFNRSFDVINKISDENECALVLKNNYDGSLPGYPFSFETLVTYSFQTANKLSCETVIQNTSESMMPMSFGWHPLFLQNVNINDIDLKINTIYKVATDDNQIPDGKTSPFTNFSTMQKISDNEFDHCFKLEENASGFSSIIIRDTNQKITVEIKIEIGNKKFRYAQLYIPPHRNTIAIEPMTSWPDAFNNKQDLIQLLPNEMVSLNYSIEVTAY